MWGQFLESGIIQNFEYDILDVVAVNYLNL